MTQPSHCLRCVPDGAAVRLCPLHAQAPALRAILEDFLRQQDAFNSASYGPKGRIETTRNGLKWDVFRQARAVLKEIEA